MQWVSIHEENPNDVNYLKGASIPVWVKDKGMFMGVKQNDNWIAKDFNGNEVDGEVVFYLYTYPPTELINIVDTISKMELDKPVVIESLLGFPSNLIEHELIKRKNELNGYTISRGWFGTEITLEIISSKEKYLSQKI